MSDEVYGYRIVCNFLTASGVERREFHKKTKSETTARKAPIFKRGFVEVVEVEPFTREQYLRCFGEGRM